jgi:hypothetical protein
MEYTFNKVLNRYRVWMTDWPADKFEILSPAEFESLQKISVRFPGLFTLTKHDSDEGAQGS